MLKGLAPCSGMSASRSTTYAPRSASRRPSVLPMKPRPPVTRTRLPVKEAGAVMSVARGRPSDRDWSPGSEVLALHDEPPPPAEQGEQRGGDPWDVEELRVAVLPVPVMHRHFDDRQPRVLHLLHQLDGDGTGRGLEHQALQYAAPHEAEVAVYVSDPETKGELDGVLVDEADHDAVKRVVPFDLVAVHHCNAVAHGLAERRQLTHVVLSVAIGVEDPVLGCDRKAGPQHAAVSARLPVVDDAQPRVVTRQLVEDTGGVVGGAVVDDHHFVVVGELLQGLERAEHHCRDCAGVVVAREESGDAAELLHHAARLPLRARARTVRPNGSPVRATSGASRRSSQRRGTFSAPNSRCRSGVACAAGRKRSEVRFSTATGKRNMLAYETCSIVKPARRSLALTARAV